MGHYMTTAKHITEEELAKHDGNATEHWIAVRGKVYDVTKFLANHPGGAGSLKLNAGKDCTINFDLVGHSKNAIAYMENFFKGNLVKTRAISEEELAKHDGNATEHWIAVRGKVYDVTKFLANHPGGAGSLKLNAGKDCTVNFDLVGHSKNAIAYMENFFIGKCAPTLLPTPPSSVATVPTAGFSTSSGIMVNQDGHGTRSDLAAFDPNEFRLFEITKIDVLSTNTKCYRIALPSSDHTMGAPTVSHIFIRNKDGGMKPYTPTSLNSDKGFMELVIKTYPGGKVSSYMDSLKVRDNIEVKLGIKKFHYETNMKEQMSFIAGGTGLTPCLQIILEALSRPDDSTRMILIFANTTESDILMKSRLDDLAMKNSNRLKIVYVLSQPERKEAWEGQGGLSGRLNADVLRTFLPGPDLNHMIYVCGPPPFMLAVSGGLAQDYSQGSVSGALDALGYSGDMVFKF